MKKVCSRELRGRAKFYLTITYFIIEKKSRIFVFYSTTTIMLKINKYTLRELVVESATQFGPHLFVSLIREKPISYAGMIPVIRHLQEDLLRMGVKKGDRVALLGPNMPQWAMAYLAVVSMGAVVVPVMPEFTPGEIGQVLDHSESNVLIASRKQLDRLVANGLSLPEHRLLLEEVDTAPGIKGKEKPENLALLPAEVEEDDLAAVIYTSGTTGNSKGVMLTHRNIVFDAIRGYDIQPVGTEDTFLSILPLAHTYENTLGLILPILGGARIYYLDKPPTASVLVPAMKAVKPTCMLSVPLVIEKIYRNSVVPSLTKNAFMRALYQTTFFRKILHYLAGKKLYKTFGGKLVFFGIGGSKLDGTVERFLREARFPYAIGYGLTETSPLVAGGIGRKIAWQSTGPVIRDVEVKLEESQPGSGQGEILVRGDNVMKGYYRRPDLTKQVMTSDGWFRTGDLGLFDRKGNLHINGRIKNMILGANGKNIMPEDIESVINSYKNVLESLVIKQKGKLVALVHLNREEIEKRVQELLADARQSRKEAYRSVEEYIDYHLNELHKYVNARVNKFSRLQMVVYHPQPFEKTATHKIKRYLYS